MASNFQYELDVVTAIFDIPKILPSSYNILFSGLRLARKDDGWLIVLKGWRGRDPMCAYVFAGRYETCLETLVDYLSKRRLQWTADSYPIGSPPVRQLSLPESTA